MFTFDNTVSDYSTKPRWHPGEPWDDRFTDIALDARDKALEDHVNADYVQRTFTANLWQLAPLTTDILYATFTRGAKVHVEMALKCRVAGTAGTEILVQFDGLPAGRPTVPFLGAATADVGSFLYFEIGVAIIAGTCLYDGEHGEMSLYAGGAHTAGIGSDPNFAAANGDGLIVNWTYTPALDA